MTSNSNNILTPRDMEVLHALTRTELDSALLLELSTTFEQPFPSSGVLLRRLRALDQMGLIYRFRYATQTPGVTRYFKLTPRGHQLLHGVGEALPPRSRFRETPLGTQQHARELSQVIVKLLVSAQGNQAKLNGFYRENELNIDVSGEFLRPDCGLHLAINGKVYSYLIELDRSTEPPRSRSQRNSLLRKIQLYDQYRNNAGARHFVVLTVFSRSRQRMHNFLDLARQETSNPDRMLFFGIFLSDLLANDPLTAPIAFDHNRTTGTLTRTDFARTARQQDATSQDALEYDLVVW